jgi:hypothetical protein
MTTTLHSDRAHAKLSASGAERWMVCTGSPQFEEGFEDQDTDFSKEGTVAHELSEILLSRELGLIDKRKANSLIKAKQKSEYYNADMLGYVEQYVDYVMERVNAARAITHDAVVMIEQRLDFSEWVPEGFGTGDMLIIGEGFIEIIDLKFGKGVKKYAPENPQMKLYGLGALHMYDAIYDIKSVRMTIVQPRLDHISTDELTAFDLYDWAESTVRTIAEEAYGPGGKFQPGDHCKFCKGRAVCRARAEDCMETVDAYKGAELSLEEIGLLLAKVDNIGKWCKEVADHAYKQATLHGKKIPGYKLVAGRSNRKFTNIGTVKEILLGEKYKPEQIIKPEELISMTDIEALLGKKKFTALLDGCTTKAPGKPALVPESDKRDELNSAKAAKSDFDDDFEDN